MNLPSRRANPATLNPWGLNLSLPSISVGVLHSAEALGPLTYRKIPRIRPPFDAQKFMPNLGGGLIREDLTFYIKIKSRNEQVFQSIKRE